LKTSAAGTLPPMKESKWEMAKRICLAATD
jgi:hypothetical protein